MADGSWLMGVGMLERSKLFVNGYWLFGKSNGKSYLLLVISG